jgi:Putative transmembrane protein (Alph_Pro_TM)
MRRPSLLWKACWIAAALPAVLGAQAAWADSPAVGAPADIRVEPKEIQVGMFYRGTKVHVEGTAPADGKVALVCAGHESDVELKKKGKVGGVLWMNVGDISFQRVPSLFLVSSEWHAARSGGSAPAATPAVGYESVEARVLPADADGETRELFREFIRMKEREQLYSSGNGPTRSSPSRVSADFWLPASVPPGEYEVRMLGERGSAAEVLGTQKFVVKRVGVAALITSMARQHGLVYGVLSVVFAIAMGFLTGVLFKASKKGH